MSFWSSSKTLAGLLAGAYLLCCSRGLSQSVPAAQSNGEFSVADVDFSDFAGKVKFGGNPTPIKPKPKSEFLWIKLTVGQGAKLPLKVGLFDIRVVDKTAEYPLLGIDTVIKDTCCNVYGMLSESYTGEVLSHVGSATSDSELTINLLGKKDAALILRKAGTVFSLAFEVPEGDRSRGFELLGVGQKAISFKRPTKNGTKK